MLLGVKRKRGYRWRAPEVGLTGRPGSDAARIVVDCDWSRLGAFLDDREALVPPNNTLDRGDLVARSDDEAGAVLSHGLVLAERQCNRFRAVLLDALADKQTWGVLK